MRICRYLERLELVDHGHQPSFSISESKTHRFERVLRPERAHRLHPVGHGHCHRRSTTRRDEGPHCVGREVRQVARDHHDSTGRGCLESGDHSPDRTLPGEHVGNEPETGGFQGELRNYKLKYYGSNGKIASESYHGVKFSSSQTYNVVLEWKTGGGGYVQSTVDGRPFMKVGSVSETFTLGIGNAPTVPGFQGAVYTNIVWPAGAKDK